MNDDRPYLGVLLMLCFCAVVPLADAMAKILSTRMAVGQLLAIRLAFQAVILVPIVALTGRSLVTTRPVFRLIAMRTALHIAGMAAMFLSLRYLPLADAVAIAFVMPFVILLLGRYALGEAVGPHRLAACAVGFAGTLLVIQPNFSDVGAPALLPVAVAVIFALFMLVTRRMAKDIDPLSLQAISGLLGTAVLLPAVFFADLADLSPLSLGALQGRDWANLVLLGSLGTAAHLLMTWSLRFAPAATLAPMQYLEIPFATLIGWLIFRDLPNGLAAAGIVVTVGAGLYIVARERAAARAHPA